MNDDLFSWASRDTCKSREEGEALVLGHTPQEYRDKFFKAVETLMESGQPFTSEEVREIAGPPPNHPSAVGALMSAAAKRLELIPTRGYRRAVGRHQHLLTVWSKAKIDAKPF